MAAHVLPEDVERFLKGALPLAKSHQLLDHLLRGCSNCSLAVAQGSGLAPRKVPESAYDAVMSKAVTRASGAQAAHQEAVAILTSLLLGERAWRDLSGPEMAALQGLPQLRTLLDAGFSLRHEDPQATLRFARLARYAADRLSPVDLGHDAVADLRALAWAELGNAYRICDDLSRANRAMNRAVHWAARGSSSTLLLARVADLLASLLNAQRRCTEARELLQLVYDIHEKAGRTQLAGRALFSAATMALTDGVPGEAIFLYRRALSFLDGERDGGMVTQSVQGLITCLADLGRFRTARRLLWQSRHRIVEDATPLDLVRLRWLEGRIYAGLGDLRRAEEAFEATREGFAEHGKFYGAAIAGLDLATLLARQGRYAEVRALAGEMIATFRAVRIAREAIVTLLILQKACDQGRGQILEIIDMVGSFLKELEHQPARRLEAGPGQD